MNQALPVKLLFDECIGKPHVDALSQFISCNRDGGHVSVCHLFEHFERGMPDAEWIPAAAKGGFVLISADRHRRRGRQKSRGAPLPRLCTEYGLTHLLYTGTMGQQKMFDKMLAVLSVWHALLVEVASSQPGSRFSLEYASRGQCILKKKPLECEPPPPRGRLF